MTTWMKPLTSKKKKHLIKKKHHNHHAQLICMYYIKALDLVDTLNVYKEHSVIGIKIRFSIII